MSELLTPASFRDLAFIAVSVFILVFFDRRVALAYSFYLLLSVVVLVDELARYGR